MKQYQKGRTHIVIIGALVVVIVVVLAYVFINNSSLRSDNNNATPQHTMNTLTQKEEENQNQNQVSNSPATETIDMTKWATVDGASYTIPIPDGWRVERIDTDGQITVVTQLDVDTQDALKYANGQIATIKQTTLSGGRGINANFLVNEGSVSELMKDYDAMMQESGYSQRTIKTTQGYDADIYKKTYEQDGGGVGTEFYVGTVEYIIDVKSNDQYVSVHYQVDPRQQNDYSYVEAAVRAITLR